MKEKIVFKTISGSKLYGTNGESSDTDIKGVFLPEKRDLILGTAPRHFVVSTGEQGIKNNSSDVDECYYSLQYFMELLAKGDTNALDMFFAYSNKDAVLFASPEWGELIANSDKVLTKNMKSYLGYCKSQSIKYSVKGEKLNNFKQFRDFCNRYIEQRKQQTGERFTVKEVLEMLVSNFDKRYIPKPGLERIKFNEIVYDFNFGGHCYVETELNHESYLSISDVKFSLNDQLDDALYKVNKVIASYGKRAENAAKDNGADYKAISHAVRVALQVEEILTTGNLVFPLKYADFIKSIKYKTTDMSFDEIIGFLEERIEKIDNVLLPDSCLPEKADRKWMDEFILKFYRNMPNDF